MPDFNWHELWTPRMHPLETVVRAALVYLFAQVVLRAVGRKELGRYATYDVVMLFLVATALRRTLVGEDSSLTTGFLSLGALGAMDWVFSLLSFLDARLANVLRGPVLELIRDGRFNERNLRRCRVSRDELLSAVRAHGREGLGGVRSAYLEPSGKITFQFRTPPPEARPVVTRG
jgi:uncharacterized membrane protein YcaP (DUF421 family)